MITFFLPLKPSWRGMGDKNQEYGNGTYLQSHNSGVGQLRRLEYVNSVFLLM